MLGIGCVSAHDVWRTCKVFKVLDGDSLQCKDGNELRYAGIDSPEKGEPYAQESYRFHRSLVADKIIRYRVYDRDRYGRKVVLAYIQGDAEPAVSVNEYMLQEGMAWFYWHPSVEELEKDFLRIQRRAMQNFKGLWVWIKKLNRPVEANKRSRKFHREGCPFAAKISERNRINYPRIWDAFYEGFAPARDCLPLNYR